MDAIRLEQMQALMRLERQPPKKEAATAPVSDLMDVTEAAAYLRCSVSQLYTLTRHAGLVRARIPIPVIRFGKALKFRTSSLDRWLSELEKAG